MVLKFISLWSQVHCLHSGVINSMSSNDKRTPCQLAYWDWKDPQPHQVFSDRHSIKSLLYLSDLVHQRGSDCGSVVEKHVCALGFLYMLLSLKACIKITLGLKVPEMSVFSQDAPWIFCKSSSLFNMLYHVWGLKNQISQMRK